MTFDEIAIVLEHVAYKPGWKVKVHLGAGCVMYMQVHYDGTGAYGPEPWTGRKWQVSQWMTATELVHTAFKAVLAAEEHETREFFKYKGVEVCGPHWDVEDIVGLVRMGRLQTETRTDAMQGA